MNMEVLHYKTLVAHLSSTLYLIKHFQKNLYCLNDKSGIYNKIIDDQAMFYTILYTFTTRVLKMRYLCKKYDAKYVLKTFAHGICSTVNDIHIN